MIAQDWSEFWWSSITGAHLIVTKVADALLENTNVILDVPADLPWRQQMRSVIEDEFRRESGYPEIIIEVIDAADEFSGQLNPGKFLLERYAPNKEIRNGYRERSNLIIQDYIRTNGVLKNRVIWVKGLSAKCAEQWVSFCREYKQSSAQSGLFVLEVHNDITKYENQKLRIVRFSDCVSAYDVQLFSSFVAEEIQGLSLDWKEYISTAVASICDTDAEVSLALIEQIDIKVQSPLDTLATIAGLSKYAPRGAEKDSNHVFAYLRRGDRKELTHRLWNAQVKTLFPLIEVERVQIIEHYREELQTILDSYAVEQFNSAVTSPIELELGTLCYLMSAYYCIRDKSTRDRIFFLHTCRNHLAHAHCCDVLEVRALLEDALRF